MTASRSRIAASWLCYAAGVSSRSLWFAALFLLACRSQGVALVSVAPAPPQPSMPAPVPAALPPPVATTAADECNAEVAQLERHDGDLTVHAPPDPPAAREFRGRLRTHVQGGLANGMARTWVGPNVPQFVPLATDGAELFLLERDGDDYVALYREPYDRGRCGGSDARNCTFVVRGFSRCGEERFRLDLDRYLSRPDHLEVQDLRVADGIVYFNEACQSYSAEARGRCSALVAVDAASGELRWRSANLISNNRFLVLGDWIVSGYGFTAERDVLVLVRRSDGEVVQRVRLAKSHEDLWVDDDGQLVVVLYGGQQRVFELRGFDGDAARLVPR